MGGSPGGGGSGPSDSGSATAIDPLGADAFVFWRNKHIDQLQDYRMQIWSYSVDTKQERLISNLDSNVRVAHLAGGLRLSPDRRWVAFSGQFRFDPSDQFALRTNRIWKVSVDGKTFVPATPPPADPRDACSANNPCRAFEQQTCEAGRCTPFAWRYVYENPVWTPDGQNILFHLVNQYCTMFSCRNWTFDMIPGPWIVSVSVAMSIADRPASSPEQLPDAVPGCSHSDPTLSPDGKRLAVEFSCGVAGDGGIALMDRNGANVEKLTTVRPGRLAWHPDGSGLFYGTLDAKQLRYFDLQNKTEKLILDSAPDDPLVLGGFAVSPTGQWLLFSQRTKDGRSTNLYLVDLHTAGALLQQLTTDGTSSL